LAVSPRRHIGHSPQDAVTENTTRCPAALHDNADTATRTIDSIGATAEDAELLRVPEGTPLLRVRRRAFTTDGTPIESSDDRYLHTKASFTLNSTRNSPSGLSMISG